MDAVIEFGKILIPASVVLYAVYLMVRTQVNKELELRKLDVRAKSVDAVLPIRLQAYERMTLFLERISPQNLLVRVSSPGMPSREFHQLLLQEIRNEFSHNVSQQVYMSHDVWERIRNAKEDLILSINEAAGEVPADAPSIELSKKIFEKTMTKPADLISHALIELKQEIQRSF